MTRLFDAPRRLVWEAMSKPEHIRRWWGALGEGYSVPVCEVDLRIGGKWRFVNRHPKGEAEFYGEYREIAPPERIVYRNRQLADGVFADNPPPSFLRVITLEPLPGNRTRLTLNACFDTAANKHAVVRRGFREGTLESYDKLAAHLATLGEAP
jgi:uncharacterized protein YndB with AHSA1/START domain